MFIISRNLSGDEQIVSQAIIDNDGVAAHEIAWEAVVVAQCRAKFPPENVRDLNTIVKDGVTSTMLIDFRLETDSQYSIIVMSGESGNVLLTPEQFAETLTVSLSNLRPVHRNGADGVAAKVETGDRMLPRGTEIEILKKGNVLVITHYQPYSATRNPERDELIPKYNERELDKPEEFFASITIL
ncbi:MAG: hypothetical protein EA381_20885 [Planctomycetaceae bacterium]|nr:MAG: hypothetical protein EA381_20885 [Planctomycetaceae bacterium]